ncbi:hypothetical protein ACT3TD_12250 [Corynebacterium sp. AOP36-E1-14]|uniref:hypothetical protein n=1 Tax=Corynebacterium sp. AOP36-E1-14 TaxID=3457682 RepID=UPI004033F1FD
MNKTLPRDSRDAADYREWRQEWMLAVIREGFGKNVQAIAVALCFHAWTKTDADLQRGTYTYGNLRLADAAGIMPDAAPEKRRRVVTDALAPLKKGGWVTVERPGNGRRGMNGMVRLTAPNDLTPVDIYAAHPEPLPENRVQPLPENRVQGLPENRVPTPCIDREQTVDINTNPHPTGEGTPNHTTEEHTDFDHFTAVVEKQKRWELSQYCDSYEEYYESMLDEFSSAKGCDTSKNWVAAFKGFVRDWSQTHGQSSPSRPSQGTATDADATPVSGDTPAPVLDAEIVPDNHTEEESTMTPLRFSALFTEDPRPGTARCLSALSKLQKAGVTDEEIHRAHEAGRMGQHPNPDDCAERIITDRETITADCPF